MHFNADTGTGTRLLLRSKFSTAVAVVGWDHHFPHQPSKLFLKNWPHVLFSNQACLRSNHQNHKERNTRAHTLLTQSSKAGAWHSNRPMQALARRLPRLMVYQHAKQARQTTQPRRRTTQGRAQSKIKWGCISARRDYSPKRAQHFYRTTRRFTSKKT